MPAPNGGRSGGNNKKKNGDLVENLRSACPPQKVKDLDKLVKSMNGDEVKIMAQIQEWWEGPQEEETWEDVSKKAPKKKQSNGGGGSRGAGRGQGPGRGRVRNGAGGRGGGGTGRDKNGRSGDRARGGSSQQKQTAPQPVKSEEAGKNGEQNGNGQPRVAPPATTARPPKGAWGARAPLAASASAEPTQKAPQPKPEDITPPTEANPLKVGMVSRNDPTPSGMTGPMETKPMSTTGASGNVWATKGSAHLIQAEKPKPPAIAPARPSKPVEPAPPVTSQVVESALESGLPPTVTGGAWSKGAPKSKKPVALDMPTSPAASKGLPNGIPTAASIEDPVPVSPEPAVPPSPVAPTNVLNMGHWETGDADDAQNLDFAFGSFGTDNDAVDASNAAQAASKEVDPASAVSPARPPPGLSLGGMPPMPDAVMVHELENKMENSSLNAASKKDKPEEKSLQAPPPGHAPAPVLPSQQNYNQYGMAGGMYNYTAAAGNGFVGMHSPAGPVIAGVPQQHGKPQAGGITGPSATTAPQAVPQQGLYGSQPPAAPSSGNGAGTETAGENTAAPTAAGMPPGIPGAIPYANPALHYGQHQFYMGQHQGGIGYNYPYGQFGGVAQGGFGYQQVMGQSQGYGGPHYDDQSHQANSHHSGGSGGYQKNNGGGYRGRNSHHNNNQYQNQYNPQHGGYGGQPYGMGFQDHYNQRGGYGPAGMGDPYGMQQGNGNYQSGGAQNFQDDDHQKGKKGGRGNGAFQQAPPPQLNGQQGFGLQGQGSETTPSTAAAGGGWSNNQAGGWSGAAQGWQAS